MPISSKPKAHRVAEDHADQRQESAARRAARAGCARCAARCARRAARASGGRAACRRSRSRGEPAPPTAGDAKATNSATSIGPTMKIISISTDSSEYAAASRASSREPALEVGAHADRDRRKARARRRGERRAPRDAARSCNGGDQRDQRGGKEHAAGDQDPARPVAVDQRARGRARRPRARPHSSRWPRRPARRSRCVVCTRSRMARPVMPDRQAAEHRGGERLPQIARLEQRGVAGEGNHGVASRGARLSHAGVCCDAAYSVVPRGTSASAAVVPRGTIA